MISWTGNSLMSGGPCIATPAAATPLNPRLESVEILARLPKIDDAPAAIDRARRVEHKPLGRIALGIDVVMNSIELLLRDTWKLQADTDRHEELFR
jgi:hypothetical protein